MKPFVTLAEARVAADTELSLHLHDGHHYLRVNRQPLMGTNASESEKVLAEVSCGRLRAVEGARVLIGGLGFGFSLRRVLERVGADATVHVAELMPVVVNWNREYLGEVNGALLDDPRVTVFVEDVFEVMKRAGSSPYDAVLLDVDNGPIAMVQEQNGRLYDHHGFAVLKPALKKGGVAAYWSAKEDRFFERRLTRNGFKVDVVAAKAYPQAKRAVHRIYVVTVAD